jgi:hypothetical protein
MDDHDWRYADQQDDKSDGCRWMTPRNGEDDDQQGREDYSTTNRDGTAREVSQSGESDCTCSNCDRNQEDDCGR